MVHFYKVKEVASLLLVDEETVRRWIRNGELKATAWPSRKKGYKIDAYQLDDFLRKNKKYDRFHSAGNISFLVGRASGLMIHYLTNENFLTITDDDVRNFFSRKVEEIKNSIVDKKAYIEHQEKEIAAIRNEIEDMKNDVEAIKFMLNDLDIAAITKNIISQLK